MTSKLHVLKSLQQQKDVIIIVVTIIIGLGKLFAQES